MTKLLSILIIGLIFESAGVVSLKIGITQIGDMKEVSVAELVRVVKAGATNVSVLLGVFCEAVFFASLLILMAKSDISFLWPLTGLSFVFATFAAMWFLHEQVSSVRWAGVVFIMIGAALISYSEHAKPKLSPHLCRRSPAHRQRARPELTLGRTIPDGHHIVFLLSAVLLGSIPVSLGVYGGNVESPHLGRLLGFNPTVPTRLQ